MNIVSFSFEPAVVIVSKCVLNSCQYEYLFLN